MEDREKLREVRKQMLPLVTTFSPLDSLSKLGSPLGLPKEFAQMEQRLQEIHPKEEDRMFYYHSSEINPCIIAVPYQGTLNLGDDTTSVSEG